MLKLQVKERSRWVEDGARARQRIQAWLELGNPHLYKAFGGELFTKRAVAFLRRYVDPRCVRRIGRRRLARFLDKHGRGGASARLADAVWQACETTRDWYEPMGDEGALPFDYRELQRMISRELDLIEFLARQVRELDAAIAGLYAVLDPERILETQVPGIGPTIAAAIEAWVGDVDRFRSCSRFASYFGLVPRSSQTGVGDGTNSQRITKAGPALLKQYMFLAAEVARRKDPCLAASCSRAIASGKHHYSAVIVVAHKLLRKIYAILKQRSAARRVRAAGGVSRPVEYHYLVAHTGERLSKEAASEYVSEHHPSKSAQHRRAAEVADTAQRSGSPGGATSGPVPRRQATGVPEAACCGKTVDRPVGNSTGDGSRGGDYPT